jgi:hypothetical protein
VSRRSRARLQAWQRLQDEFDVFLPRQLLARETLLAALPLAAESLGRMKDRYVPSKFLGIAVTDHKTRFFSWGELDLRCGNWPTKSYQLSVHRVLSRDTVTAYSSDGSHLFLRVHGRQQEVDVQPWYPFCLSKEAAILVCTEMAAAMSLETPPPSFEPR